MPEMPWNRPGLRLSSAMLPLSAFNLLEAPILGPEEAFRAAQVFAASTFKYTPLIAAALLYLCVTIPLTRIVDHMQARAMRERGGALALGIR